MTTAVHVIIGLALLVLGGEIVVRGAGKLALALGVRPLVVGLTVVAFCTSAPELAASITAALAGSPDLAVGNVIGSNIANIGLILGISALVRPVAVQSIVLSREAPVMVGATLLVILLAQDGGLGRFDGALLLSVLVVYVVLMVRSELRTREPRVEKDIEEAVGPARRTAGNLGLVILGVGLLVLGADQLVTGAVALAREIGVSEKVVGLTIMAVGTSLPELAASLAATRKGEGDLVLGNVVGSNTFNLLCVLGAAVVIRPIPDGLESFSRDFWVTFGFSAFLVPLLRRGHMLYRSEAALLIAAWGVYLWSLV